MPDPAGSAASPPRVSVCVPVYQGGRFVGETIRSILAQTLFDFELVVLDNASTDGTLAEVSGFTDGRIRVVVNETNLGATGNFNRALAEARGRYVKIVCADDVIAPGCLAAEVAALEQDAEGSIAMVTCAREVVDADGRRLLTRSFGRSGRVDGRAALRRVVRSGANPIGEPAAVLFRADRIPRAGVFEEKDRFALDLGYWARLLLTGDLYVLPDVLSAFRVHDAGWTASIGASQARQYREWVTSLRRDPEFGITALDEALSAATGAAVSLGRRFFYLAGKLRSGR